MLKPEHFSPTLTQKLTKTIRVQQTGLIKQMSRVRLYRNPLAWLVPLHCRELFSTSEPQGYVLVRLSADLPLDSLCHLLGHAGDGLALQLSFN